MLRVSKGNGTPIKNWSWNNKRLLACQLVVEGNFSYRKIAETVGIDPITLEAWRLTPEFEARRKELHAEFAERIMNQGIAVKANRVAALDRLHQIHTRIVEQRVQAAPTRLLNESSGGGTSDQVPGVDTGLVVIEEKMAGYDEDGKAIFRDQAVFDQSLSREYRATLAQAAEELGHLTSKTELTGKDGGPLEVTVGVMDQVAERVRDAKKRLLEEELDSSKEN